ncbi:predicted protein [Naegleria gruberi]|uniref:Predicted protein n=1 Tax=Naegleria gruberi TaxID=5762 RepID=D2VTQ1_NAEGR|nr:uncharacterized protein NAEGRDRAFT_59191 [Naegleria gruberi]EFC39693.1 predicted protein [Naegleria gruberi]|eukprot:XP_002672437.1 predicted protein [Naegleria gruberi strain NEG-M]
MSVIENYSNIQSTTTSANNKSNFTSLTTSTMISNQTPPQQGVVNTQTPTLRTQQEIKADLYQAVIKGMISRVQECLEELLSLAHITQNTANSTGQLSSPVIGNVLYSTSPTSPTHVSTNGLVTTPTSDLVNSVEESITNNHPVSSPNNSVSSSSSSLMIGSPNNHLSTHLSTSGSQKLITMDQIILKTTFPEEFDMNVVHLSAKHAQADILQHVISSACCDEKCSNTNGGPNANHSNECQRKTNALLSSVDKQNATPIFYAVQSGSNGICAFLCSFKIVQDQLNLHADRYGFLPVHWALKRKQFEISDTLQLFGAKLDTTVGIGVGLGESVLHIAVREKSMESIEYLAKTKPGILLKKNSQEENALFVCLTDFRGTRIKRIEESFLTKLLPTGGDLFGNDAFERAILQKNGHGRNILMESIAKNDMSSFYAILQYLYHEKNSTKQRLIPILFNEVDSQQKNLMHLCVQSVFLTGMAFDPDTDEASLDWMNALEWTHDFIETVSPVLKLSKMAHLFLAKDKYGDTPKESCNQFYDATSDAQEPLIIAESISESLLEAATSWASGKKRKSKKGGRKTLNFSDTDENQNAKAPRASSLHQVMDFIGITVKRGFKK